jgi:hypothetical protein
MNDTPQDRSNASAIVGYATIGLIVLVGVCAFVEPAQSVAILVGAVLFPALGVLLSVAIMVMGLLGAMSAASERRARGNRDFSSFGPQEEAAFVPHEERMRANLGKGNLAAAALGGIMLIFGVVIYLLYSPCTAYCDRPPAVCSGQKDAWSARCPAACEAFASQNGHKEVQHLAGCVFSGGGGESCKAVMDKGIQTGLVCERKD